MAFSSGPSQKKYDLLKYLGSLSLPNVLGRIPHNERRFLVGRHRFPLIAPPPFEDTEEDEDCSYIILLADHPEGEGMLLAPRSLLQIRWKVKSFPDRYPF